MLDATPTTEKWNDFDFIGHLRDGEYGNPEWPPVNGQSFDRDHEGHWGWTTDAVLGQLDFWLGGLNAALECCSGFRIPDIALVHLGTNDCINGENVNAILAELKQVVSILHDHNPGMHVFIAKVIPANDANIQPCLDELNGNMDDFFASVTSGRVTVVDMASGFNVVTDLWDNLHPNAQGSEKMANRWFDAIMANY